MNTTYEDTGNHPKERIQHSQHSESLKSSNENMCMIKENLDSIIQNPSITVFDVTVHITYLKVPAESKNVQTREDMNMDTQYITHFTKLFINLFY